MHRCDNDDADLRILVTGAAGMLGTALLDALTNVGTLFATASRPMERPRVPFLAFPLQEGDYGPLRKFCRPHAIVNCAAMTSHEQCEADPEMAGKVNALAPAKLARCFPGAYIVQISTDAVFGPAAKRPDESFPTNPIGVYGRTKLAGEEALLNASPQALVLRTTIVGTGGRRSAPGLVDWLLGEYEAGREAPLFTDVFFTPISVWHFAEIVKWGLRVRPQGVIHAAGSESLSKQDFALRLARRAGFDRVRYRSECLLQRPGGAIRRLDQSLDCRRLERLKGGRLPDAGQCIESIVERGI